MNTLPCMLSMFNVYCYESKLKVNLKELYQVIPLCGAVAMVPPVVSFFYAQTMMLRKLYHFSSKFLRIVFRLSVYLRNIYIESCVFVYKCPMQRGIGDVLILDQGMCGQHIQPHRYSLSDIRAV